MNRVLERTIILTHQNLENYVNHIETNRTKIQKLTNDKAIMSGGIQDLNDILKNLDAKHNIVAQITTRLKQKNIKGLWVCYVAEPNSLHTITYRNGNVTVEEEQPKTIRLSCFTPECEELFKAKYYTIFSLATIKEKVQVISDFFEEVTKLYEGLAGGKPIMAKLDSEGFKWI
jgi:hypothetical protein